MKVALGLTSVIAATIVAITPAAAAEVIVNSVAALPTATSWGTIATENVGGTIAVTSTVAKSGTGSLEMKGDRTRAQIGIQYSPFTTNLGNLSDANSLTFDWRIAGDSISGYNPDYTPALRLLIQDGTARKELIWEGVYNGTYGNTDRDTWYSSTANDLFYLGGSANANLGMTIADWAKTLTQATISGISVGAGSGALTTYHAFADNVTFSTKSGASTTYNFEPAVAAVPEPATWIMMFFGFGMIGFGMRRRVSVSNARFEDKLNQTYASIKV